MKKALTFLLFLGIALCFWGCGQPRPVLHVFIWSDSLSPDLVEKFEKENNCRVVCDTYDSNESLLAKLEAGATGYDLIVPSHYIVPLLAKRGLIVPLDKSKLNIMDKFDEDVLKQLPGNIREYGLPYMMSYTGIGYNNQVVKDFKPSWKMFERNDLQKRATLLDDKREVIGAALLSAGMDPNSTDAKELGVAKSIITEWLKNVSKFENEQYKNGIASKEFYLVMGYSGDMMQVVRENPHVSFAIPEEGCLMCCDMMCIPKGFRNQDLAYRFLNYIYEPKHCAENIEYLNFLCPIKEAYPLIPENMRNDPTVFIPKKILEKSAFTSEQGDNEGVYNLLWGQIKAGR